jgi:hypothetical protein
MLMESEVAVSIGETLRVSVCHRQINTGGGISTSTESAHPAKLVPRARRGQRSAPRHVPGTSAVCVSIERGAKQRIMNVGSLRHDKTYYEGALPEHVFYTTLLRLTEHLRAFSALTLPD